MAGAGTNTYTDAAVTSKTAYYYVVTGRANSVEGAPSAEATATTPAVVTPFVSVFSGVDKVTLTFTYGSGAGGVTGGKLYRGTAAGVQTVAANLIATFTKLTTTYDDVNVTSGTTYYYTLIASDATGDSLASGETSLKYVDPQPPSVVSSVSATVDPLSPFQVKLSWTNPAESDFTGVVIKRSATGYPTSATSTAASDGVKVVDSSGPAGGTTTYTDTQVPGGTLWYYSLFAHDGQPKYAAAAQIGATPPSANIYAYSGSSSGILGFQIDPVTKNSIPMAGSPFSQAIGNGVTVDPRGKFLYTVYGTGIYGFTIAPASGALTLIGNFGVPGSPSRIVVDPSGKFLFVTDTSATITGGLSVFSIDQTTGALSQVAGSPFSTGNKPQMVALYSSLGVPKVAFVANKGSPTGSGISTYQITAATSTVAPISTGTPTVAGVSPTMVAVDTGTFTVHAMNSGSVGASAITSFVFDPSLGTLGTADAGYTGCGVPVAIAAIPGAPGYVYMTSSASSCITSYSTNASTAFLRTPSNFSLAASSNPTGLAVDSTGFNAYTPNNGTGTVGAYTISSGVLSEKTGSPVSTGSATNPKSITLDDTWLNLAFVPSANSGIAVFSINSGTGALTLLSTSPLTATQPKGFTIVHLDHLSTIYVYSESP